MPRQWLVVADLQAAGARRPFEQVPDRVADDRLHLLARERATGQPPRTGRLDQADDAEGARLGLLGVQAEQQIAANAIAAARVQALRAVPWRFELAGTAPEVPSLAIAPPDALDRDAAGFFEIDDEAGRPVSAAERTAPAFVVRWRVSPVPAVPVDARLIEVCVSAWPSAGRPPLVCLGTARVRQP